MPKRCIILTPVFYHVSVASFHRRALVRYTYMSTRVARSPWRIIHCRTTNHTEVAANGRAPRRRLQLISGRPTHSECDCLHRRPRCIWPRLRMQNRTAPCASMTMHPIAHCDQLSTPRTTTRVPRFRHRHQGRRSNRRLIHIPCSHHKHHSSLEALSRSMLRPPPLTPAVYIYGSCGIEKRREDIPFCFFGISHAIMGYPSIK